MEVTDTQTKALTRLKACAGGVHPDGGGGKGVGGREEKGAPVLATNVGGGWGAGEDVVPSKASRLARVQL